MGERGQGEDEGHSQVLTVTWEKQRRAWSQQERKLPWRRGRALLQGKSPALGPLSDPLSPAVLTTRHAWEDLSPMTKDVSPCTSESWCSVHGSASADEMRTVKW